MDKALIIIISNASFKQISSLIDKASQSYQVIYGESKVSSLKKFDLWDWWSAKCGKCENLGEFLLA